MSYPRNAASPERVDIGPVIQISDGAVQTSGVAVKVIPFGGAEASGGGTIAYSADGVVLYTPTQSETNYTSFILVASKSGCIPASKTVVTSASATSGKVVLSGETHTDAVIPTVTTLTNLPAITAGWLTATGIAADAITAAKIADGAIDTATFAVGTTIPRCTLVDTTTTNTDMRGTDSAMLAASYTAPDNASITAIKAKTDNLPTDPADQSIIIDATNTILGRLPAALESGRMAAALSTARGTQIDNIETFATRITTGIVQDGVVWQFTANMLELGPSGGGGGSATLAKQEEILAAIDTISADQLAAITVESGVIGNFPETLTIGDSYTENTGQIKVGITDSNGDPISEFGSLQLSEAAISFTAFRPNDSAIITGTCEFVEEVSETYVLITLASTETSKGKAEYTYEGRLKFFWEGPSSGESDDEQKTYKTTPFKFIANP